MCNSYTGISICLVSEYSNTQFKNLALLLYRNSRNNENVDLSWKGKHKCSVDINDGSILFKRIGPQSFRSVLKHRGFLCAVIIITVHTDYREIPS